MSVKIMTDVWQSDLKQSDLIVMLAMADHANDDGGSVHPGNNRLAWKCGISTRTVERKIIKFLDNNWIAKTSDARQHYCATYKINVDQLPLKPSYQEHKLLIQSNLQTRHNDDPESRPDNNPDPTSGTSRPDIDDTQTRQNQPRPDTAMAASTSLSTKTETSLNHHTGGLLLTDPRARVFKFWQDTMNKPRAKLDDKRKKLINKSLHLGYTEAELCDAITGCTMSPFHMGDNDTGTKYQELKLILRDADQIDKFISFKNNPPTKQTKTSRRQENNLAAGMRFINEK